jgi:hypothetical protein
MIKVVLHEIRNAGPKQTDIAQRAAALLERVVNLPEFQARVAETQYTYIARQDGDDAPADVLTAIRNGVELGTAADGSIDLTVSLEVFRYGHLFPNHATIGKTPPGGPVIRTSYWWINRWIAKDDVAALAGHFMHEWMHVAGYTHRTTSGEPLDVAYAVGNIAEQMAAELSGTVPADISLAIQ